MMTSWKRNQDDLLNLIGVIGGSAISLSLVPQVILTYKTQCTTDISFFYQAIYIFGTALVNTYAIYFGYWAVYVPCLLEMILIITLTIMKVVYDKRNEKNQEKSKKTLVQNIALDLSRSAHVRTCHLTNNALDLNPRDYLHRSLSDVHKVQIDSTDKDTLESISTLANEIESLLQNIVKEKKRNAIENDVQGV